MINIMHQYVVQSMKDDTERAMTDSDTKYKIITKDFSANIGIETEEEDFKAWEHMQ